MAVTSACPDVHVLQQLAVGNLPLAEVERLAEHCEQCERCVQVLHSLKADDTLVEAMAAQRTAPERLLDPAVKSLMERLEGILSPRAVPGVEDVPTTVTNAPPSEVRTFVRRSPDGDVPTTASNAPPSEPDVLTLPSAALAEATQEIHDLLSPPEGPWELGRLGHYSVLKLLGIGGMGLVYQAEDTQLQRPVALKIMKAELAKKSRARERFVREARAAAQLKSDHIVTIHQVGVESQVVFLAMEFLEGQSLEELLKKGQRPSSAETARIGRQIALGLQAAHAHGLIHRDIKPGNVWLESSRGETGGSSPRFRVKLLDFGLARPEAEDEHHLTQSGAIVGTPGYMAPEQARSEQVDARADLFSLGVVLYRLTTGQMPFRGHNTLSVLTSLALDTPTPPREINPDLSPRLATLIERLLCKDREGRPATAHAVADELEAIEREAATTALLPAPAPDPTDVPTITLEPRPAAPVLPVAKPKSRRKNRLVALAAGLVLLAGLCAAIIVIIRDKQGNKIAEINVPKDGSVEIKEDGKDKEEPKKQVPPKEDVKIEPGPLAALSSRELLSPTALVQRPAKLPGVRSWSIATRDAWGPISIAYRPDSQRLAVGSSDGSIRVWEPQSGRLVQVLLGQGTVYPLAWSPDGRVLAAGQYFPPQKGRLRLWEAETGRLLRTLEMPTEYLDLLAWSPDGRSILATSRNPECCLVWDASDGKLHRNVPIPFGGPAAFSPDGTRLAGLSQDGKTIRIWNTETGKEVRPLGTGAFCPTNVAWSPDGKRLAAGEPKGLHVWNLDSGEECFRHEQDFGGVATASGFIAWSPDGRTLAYNRSNNFGVEIIEVKAGAKPLILEDTGNSILAWSPDGKTIARACNQVHQPIRLHDAATSRRLRSLAEGATADLRFAWSPDGQTLALTDFVQPSLVSADTGQAIAALKEAAGPVASSPDGKSLATGGPNHAVILWESGGKVRVTLTGHDQDIALLAWSPDSKRLASYSGGKKRLLLWDVEKAELLRELGPCPESAASLVWSPDGKYLAHGGPTDYWHVWDVEKSKLVNDPKQWRFLHFAFAPDGRSALTAAGQGFPYQLRDLTTGKEVGLLNRPAFWGPDPIFSPDGRILAVPIGADVEVWRGDLRRRVRTLHGSGLGMGQVAFSGDGNLLAGLAGQRLHVWEADTGRLRGILLLGERHNGLTIMPDGRYTGDDQVERGIVMVVQKDDGAQEVLEPADFEQKYGFKNDPNKVHLLQPLPSPLYPLPGQPMGPYALVREPAELADANVTSWTIETRSARGYVRAVAYRPDGKLLATGGDDGTIRIWDPASGELIRMLVGDHVVSLSWSPDGKVLAAGSPDEVTRLWEADAGRLLHRSIGSQTVSWGPNGQTLALNRRTEIRMREGLAQRVVGSFKFEKNVRSFAWSPDGKTLAVALEDNTLRFADVTTGKGTRKLEGEAGQVIGLAWSPDGKRLASIALAEPAFRVWDAVAGKLQKRFALEGRTLSPAIAWSSDGKTVAVGRHQGWNGLFDPDTGQLVRRLDGGNSVTALAWSPDGKQLVLAADSGVRIFNPATNKRMETLDGMEVSRQIQSLTWSSDSRVLALGYNLSVDGMRVEAATGRRQVPFPSDGWTEAAWSPDGKTFATLERAGVRLWDAATTRAIRTLDGATEMVYGVRLAWSPDGKALAASKGKQLWVWSIPSGKLLWQSEKHQLVTDLGWSPDSRRLATADQNGPVRIWEADTGKLLRETPFPSMRLAWSPDGKSLVAVPIGHGEGVLIDTASGAIRGKTQGAFWGAWVRWQPDGKSFTTVGDGWRLSDWDAATGKQQRVLQLPLFLHGWPTAAWSLDGRLLARGIGVEVHLSDEAGRSLGVLLPDDLFGRLAVTADGHYRGSARVDREIRMVVQKRDGSSETLTPAEFEQKYGFKNDPAKVRLTE
jgi:WD40 repeat protein/serine/threonine protein kinase